MKVPKVLSYRNSRTDAVPVPRSKINWRNALGPIGRLLVMALPASGYSEEDGWWRLRRRSDQRTEVGVPLRRMSGNQA